MPPRLPPGLETLAYRAREDVEVLAGLWGESPLFLGGYCAIASRHFRYVARAHGLEVDFVYGQVHDTPGYHCWNQHGAIVIDLTWTQFFHDLADAKTYGPVRIEANPRCRDLDGSAVPAYLEIERNDFAIRKTSRWRGNESYARAKPLLALIERQRRAHAPTAQGASR